MKSDYIWSSDTTNNVGIGLIIERKLRVADAVMLHLVVTSITSLSHKRRRRRPYRLLPLRLF